MCMHMHEHVCVRTHVQQKENNKDFVTQRFTISLASEATKASKKRSFKHVRI